MSTNAPVVDQHASLIAALRAEVARLARRIATLEAAVAVMRASEPPSPAVFVENSPSPSYETVGYGSRPNNLRI